MATEAGKKPGNTERGNYPYEEDWDDNDFDIIVRIRKQLEELEKADIVLK